MTRSRTIGWFVAAAVLAGCGESAQPLEPDPSFAVQQAQAGVIDISGTWLLEFENFIHLTEDAARFHFGLEPEGTRTTLRCTASGSMTLDQDGTTFTGASGGSSTCVTTGGQVLQLTGGGPIVDGQIRGRSVHFTTMDGPVACPARGAIKTVAGNQAVEMSGNWHCVEPGHPQSLWSAPPPRMGPNRSLWRAYRSVGE